MQGYTGSFAINGSNLQLQPSTFKWNDRDVLNRDGQGRAIYPALWTFDMYWGLMSTGNLKQLLDFVSASATGTMVVDLPEHGNNDYYFKSYSGTLLDSPTVGEYFNTYVTDVRLTVTNIRA